MDRQAAGGSTQRFQAVDISRISAFPADSGHEHDPQREAEEQCQGQGKSGHDRRPHHFGRQDAQRQRREPQSGQADGGEKNDEADEVRDPSRRGFQTVGQEASKPAPEEPGGQEQAVGHLVALEEDEELAQEDDLECHRQEAEEKGRQEAFQAQTPGMRCWQNRHRPD